jgi:alpha-1,2-mannosyltransferase
MAFMRVDILTTMNVGVIHDSLNFAGGAERVCLKTIEALQSKGHFVILGTVDLTDWSRVERALGQTAKPDKTVNLIRLNDGMARSYLDVLVPVVHLKIKKEVDVCINTNADAMPTKAEVNYLHYVPSCAVKGEFYREEIAARGLYSAPPRYLQQRSLKNYSSGKIITNSLFSQRAIKKCLNLSSEVIHPPVELNKFLRMRNEPRTDSVVTTGRMSPERNFEFVMSVASKMPSVNFAIVGHYSGALSKSYFAKLCRIKQLEKLQNVSIFLSDSIEKMLSLFSVSMIFLHTMKNDAFGLSVVEAMASGLVPVVHRSGGPWEDILNREEETYGYAYSNVAEAIQSIHKIISDRKVYSDINSRNRQRLEDFSDITFKNKMIQVFNGLESSMN